MVLLGCVSCASTSNAVIVSATEGLPRYVPAEAALFDDSIAPEVFGLPGQEGPAAVDPKIIERTQRADSVTRVRVATVTRDASAGEPFYTIVVVAREPAWTGPDAEHAVELRLEPSNPAVPFVALAGSGLVGKTVVLFARRYDDQGEAKLHWRAEPDTPAVRQAVERAMRLD
jgi:hypothetical protein